MNRSSTSITTGLADPGAIEHRVAIRLAAALGERATGTTPDVLERLRVAREQAVARAGAARGLVLNTPASRSGAAAVLGGGWRWLQAAAWVPLILLLAGLLAIDHLNLREQIRAAADIDAQLLADDLPPAAYSDAGFVEFLRLPPAPSESGPPP